MRRQFADSQPDSFAFTAENSRWARQQIGKYPEGRQASAIIPILMRAQEQEGWLTRPAVEAVADMLGLAHIRAYEVATFYFMFQLQPVGRIAHVQVCGTTPCMLCGSEELIEACKRRISSQPHLVSEDGSFSWEEVECLGACCNAPVVQIGRDYYEDLDAVTLEGILDSLADGDVPTPGSQAGRFSSEPASGLTSLTGYRNPELSANAAVSRAVEQGDTLVGTGAAERGRGSDA